MLLLSKLASLYALGAVGWRSFKTLKHGILDYDLLIVWTVLASLEVFEMHLEWIVSWIPFYYLVKTAVIIMIAYPRSHLPRILLEQIIVPYSVAWDDLIVDQIFPKAMDVALSLPGFVLDALFPSDDEMVGGGDRGGAGLPSSSTRRRSLEGRRSTYNTSAGEPTDQSTGNSKIQLRRRHQQPPPSSSPSRERVAIRAEASSSSSCSVNSSSKEGEQTRERETAGGGPSSLNSSLAIDEKGGQARPEGLDPKDIDTTLVNGDTGWRDWEERLARVQAKMMGGGEGSGPKGTAAAAASNGISGSTTSLLGTGVMAGPRGIGVMPNASTFFLRQLSSSNSSSKSNEMGGEGRSSTCATSQSPVRHVGRVKMSSRAPPPGPPAASSEFLLPPAITASTISNTSSSFYVESTRVLRSGVSRKGSTSSTGGTGSSSSSSSRRVIRYGSSGGEEGDIAGSGGSGGGSSSGRNDVERPKAASKGTTPKSSSVSSKQLPKWR